MNTAELNANYCATLVDEWVHQGLRYAVVAPGSRSAPLALALVRDERVRVEVVLDERSAAFTALTSADGALPARSIQALLIQITTLMASATSSRRPMNVLVSHRTAR